jgi:GNAT superfamily N-acetyltransferase
MQPRWRRLVITGSCLCRGIRFEVRGELGTVAQCHCEDCRKANGTAYGTAAPVARSAFTIVSGKELLARYESIPGKWRCFCSRCGSPIFGTYDDDPGTLRLRLGTINGDPGVRPAAHGWLADRAPWENLPDDNLPRFATGDPKSLLPRVKLRAESPDSPAAQALIGELDRELESLYPKDALFGLHDDDRESGRMVFLVARVRERPVGCGALRTLDAGLGEVKRMYVVPDQRGEGTSRRILAAIETIAIGKGHGILRLETGKRQAAAISLYRSSGYREIPLYGEYVRSAYSVCFEKNL